jgi:uncharacterized protein YceK
MKHFTLALLTLTLLAGCSTVPNRTRERQAAYEALSPAAKDLVDHGRVAAGMDTNAVYMAWGAPSLVTEDTGSSPPRTIWTYYGDKTVLTPYWAYRPTAYGYWSLESVTDHHSERYTKAEVVFENGRVVDRQQF